MKKLNRTPATLPLPNPEEMLHNLTWVENLDDSVVEIVVSKSKLVHYERGDIIYQEGEELSSMYIIVSGLVKVRASLYTSLTLPFHTLTFTLHLPTSPHPPCSHSSSPTPSPSPSTFQLHLTLLSHTPLHPHPHLHPPPSNFTSPSSLTLPFTHSLILYLSPFSLSFTLHPPCCSSSGV